MWLEEINGWISKKNWFPVSVKRLLQSDQTDINGTADHKPGSGLRLLSRTVHTDENVKLVW